MTCQDPEEPADHALGRSRGGYGTKLHVVSDDTGIPLEVTLTVGERHESKEFENVMQGAIESRCEEFESIASESDRDAVKLPEAVSGDKAYSSGAIRDWIAARLIQDVIPTKSNETAREGFDQSLYRRRNIVERVIGWLKENRRAAMRFEKNAVHYLAFVKIAIIRRLLKMRLIHRA